MPYHEMTLPVCGLWRLLLPGCSAAAVLAKHATSIWAEQVWATTKLRGPRERGFAGTAGLGGGVRTSIGPTTLENAAFFRYLLLVLALLR